MISANDVMRKIQRNDDWVTVYDMEDDYDLEASAYYAESDDELVISLSYLGDAADLALKALQETSEIGGGQGRGRRPAVDERRGRGLRCHGRGRHPGDALVSEQEAGPTRLWTSPVRARRSEEIR